MIKIEYIVGAVLVLLWARGTQAKKSTTQMEDTVASQQGSDWIGAGGMLAMWDRLSGADLVVKNYRNIDPNSAQADPGKIGALQTGLAPSWNGSIG